ncbi:MAG TPA: DUF2637 domain-containing protein [Streptosporangiaceae bacterium]|jgi:hypothetical protein
MNSTLTAVPRTLRALRTVALAAVALAVAALDGVAFAESYRGLYEWAAEHGLSGAWAIAWPLQVDTFILVGELTLLVAVIERWDWSGRLLAWGVTIGGLVVSIAGNVGHVAGGATVHGTAAVPPVAAWLGLVLGLQLAKRVIARRAAEPVDDRTDSAESADVEPVDLSADAAARLSARVASWPLWGGRRRAARARARLAVTLADMSAGTSGRLVRARVNLAAARAAVAADDAPVGAPELPDGAPAPVVRTNVDERPQSDEGEQFAAVRALLDQGMDASAIAAVLADVMPWVEPEALRDYAARLVAEWAERGRPDDGTDGTASASAGRHLGAVQPPADGDPVDDGADDPSGERWTDDRTAGELSKITDDAKIPDLIRAGKNLTSSGRYVSRDSLRDAGITGGNGELDRCASVLRAAHPRATARDDAALATV